MDDNGPETGRIPTPLAAALALVISLAPVAIQTTTLVVSRSMGTTLVVAAVVAVLFIVGGVAFQALLAGSLLAVRVRTLVGLVFAVLAYHAFALVMAYVIYVRLFAGAA